MPTRTYYFNSALDAGALVGIRSNDAALSSTDLDTIDTEAMNRVNALILEIAGPAAGGTIVTEFMNDANAIDPIFVLIAEKIAAALAFRRWEQFNLGVNYDKDAIQRKDSERLEAEAIMLAKGVMKSKSSVKADGTVRYLGATKEGGPIVVGEMREGSFFNHSAYVDHLGRTRPAATRNPYDLIGG